MHEVYLRVKSYPSILGKISKTMGDRKIDILAISGRVDDDKKAAKLVFYVEMGDSRTSVRELVAALRKKQFVLEVTSRPKGKIIYEELMFPLTSGGHYRVFTLGARSWISLLRSLNEKFGSGGAVILQEEGVAVGSEMVRKTEERLRTTDEDLLLKNLKALFGASGMGMLEITREPGGTLTVFRVEVVDPVSAESDVPLVDEFTIGILRGAVSSILSKDLVARDKSYGNRKLTFSLVEAPAVS